MPERSHPTSEVRGKKLGGPHAQRAAAKRSYPTSEIRGSSGEELSSNKVGAAAGRSYRTPPCPRSGAVAGRTNSTSKEQWLCGCRRA